MSRAIVLKMLSDSFGDLGEVIIREFEAVIRNYQLRNYELVLLYGGRFAEATYMALSMFVLKSQSDKLDISKIKKQLEGMPSDEVQESFRVQIPRVAKCVYDFRSRKDVAHVRPGASPSYIDASFVTIACQWITSEFVRLLSNRDPDWTLGIVNSIVDKKLSLVEQFGDRMVILREGLSAFTSLLILLYYRYPEPMSTDELVKNLPDFTRSNIVTSLKNAEKKKLIYRDGKSVYLTRLGIDYVEKQVIELVIGEYLREIEQT